MGCFTPGCNIFDLIRPLHPPSSVSKEPEQKGAPPIERFHHPGTERVTSAERNKDREPITHLPPIVARHPGTGHFLRRNKDLPRPCLVPQLTSWNNGLGNLIIPEHHQHQFSKRSFFTMHHHLLREKERSTGYTWQ